MNNYNEFPRLIKELKKDLENKSFDLELIKQKYGVDIVEKFKSHHGHEYLKEYITKSIKIYHDSYEAIKNPKTYRDPDKSGTICDTSIKMHHIISSIISNHHDNLKELASYEIKNKPTNLQESYRKSVIEVIRLLIKPIKNIVREDLIEKILIKDDEENINQIIMVDKDLEVIKRQYFSLYKEPVFKHKIEEKDFDKIIYTQEFENILAEAFKNKEIRISTMFEKEKILDFLGKIEDTKDMKKKKKKEEKEFRKLIAFIIIVLYFNEKDLLEFMKNDDIIKDTIPDDQKKLIYKELKNLIILIYISEHINLKVDLGFCIPTIKLKVLYDFFLKDKFIPQHFIWFTNMKLPSEYYEQEEVTNHVKDIHRLIVYNRQYIDVRRIHLFYEEFNDENKNMEENRKKSIALYTTLLLEFFHGIESKIISIGDIHNFKPIINYTERKEIDENSGFKSDNIFFIDYALYFSTCQEEYNETQKKVKALPYESCILCSDFGADIPTNVAKNENELKKEHSLCKVFEIRDPMLFAIFKLNFLNMWHSKASDLFSIKKFDEFGIGSHFINENNIKKVEETFRTRYLFDVFFDKIDEMAKDKKDELIKMYKDQGVFVNLLESSPEKYNFFIKCLDKIFNVEKNIEKINVRNSMELNILRMIFIIIKYTEVTSNKNNYESFIKYIQLFKLDDIESCKKNIDDIDFNFIQNIFCRIINKEDSNLDKESMELDILKMISLIIKYTKITTNFNNDKEFEKFIKDFKLNKIGLSKQKIYENS